MKKLNNKGFTLIELMVAIGLLSIIVLISIFLINDLIYIKNNTPLAYDNQINRAIIIDSIQQDILQNGLAYENSLTELLKDPIMSPDSATFTLTSLRGQATIILRKDSLTYIDFSGKESKWDFINAYSDINLRPSTDFTLNYFNGYALIVIRIPIYTNNVNNDPDNNNINDDIIITYYGKFLKI